MDCIICQSKSEPVFADKIFGSIETTYYACSRCGFIFQPRPIAWLAAAYSSAITQLDLGLIGRNQYYSKIVGYFIKMFLNPHAKYIDYGGGYGMFVRMLRDMGYDYYRQDLHCDNLFAKHFDITDLPTTEIKKFELLTAFEVFEHLENPIEEIQKMAIYSDTILFSTELVPYAANVGELKNWWYIAPETGQHISFYTKKSLGFIAHQLGYNYYNLTPSLHLFSKKKTSSIRNFIFRKLILRYINFCNKLDCSKQKIGLLMPDYESVKQSIRSGYNKQPSL